MQNQLGMHPGKCLYICRMLSIAKYVTLWVHWYESGMSSHTSAAATACSGMWVLHSECYNSWEWRASCGQVMRKEVLYSDGATMYFLVWINWCSVIYTCLWFIWEYIRLREKLQHIKLELDTTTYRISPLDLFLNLLLLRLKVEI